MNQQKRNGSKTRRSFFTAVIAAVGGGVTISGLVPGFLRRAEKSEQANAKTPVVTIHPQAVSRTNKGVKHG